jgi:cobalt/nickel transport system permease protein/cobalt/nickel transport protein
MRRRPPTRFIVLAGLIVALILAGVVSYYASSSPDGLNRVAIDQGFAGAETAHGGRQSPLAGYETKGLHDSHLAGGIARIMGALVVLGTAGGAVLVLRRSVRRDRHGRD